MTEDQLVRDALAAPDGWVDTPEQAQLRNCLYTILAGHDAVDNIRICADLVEVIRDQLVTKVANVRKIAAGSLRQTMTPREIAALTGLTPATVARLLTESKSV